MGMGKTGTKSTGDQKMFQGIDRAMDGHEIRGDE
jgi:hypothetical protein